MLETGQLNIEYKRLLNKPELTNLRLLFGINMFLLITSIVMPQYFGIHLGWDFTCTRFANVFLTIYGLMQYRVFNIFSKTLMRCSVTIPLMIYLLVALYTMVFRVDINAFMLVFLEILTFYMLVFAIRYVIGIENAIKVVIGCAYFLCAYGFVEFAAGHSLYLQFLRTVPTAVINCYRSGYYRIMGPCGHPLGYGLLMIIFIAIACIDYEKREMYLYKRPVLLLMLIANVFLTGSRSSQGIAAIEMVLIIIFSGKTNRKKSIFYSLAIVVSFALFLALTFKTRIGNYLMMQITMLIDQALDTELSVNFGADITTLQNSEGYREFLPYIFKLDWLNPLLGRGVKGSFSAQVFNSAGEYAFIESIDNYYICQFIKYAYPGMISYILFVLTSIVTMIRSAIKYKSKIMIALLIGFGCYFLNLWWLDALQTLKFMYILLALFYAILFWYEDGGKSASNKDGEMNINVLSSEGNV